jgi:hypothetical protein
MFGGFGRDVQLNVPTKKRSQRQEKRRKQSYQHKRVSQINLSLLSLGSKEPLCPDELTVHRDTSPCK